MTRVERQVLITYLDSRDHIADSDLDNEQTITLHVTTTLGDMRKLHRAHLRAAEALEPENDLSAESKRLRTLTDNVN